MPSPDEFQRPLFPELADNTRSENEIPDHLFDDRTDEERFDDDVEPIRSVSVEDREAYLRLALINGIGPRTMASLIAHFGSARAVLNATLRQLTAVRRIGPKLADSIRDAAGSNLAERVAHYCEDHVTSILMPGDPSYPKLLLQLEDPPNILFARGTFTPADQLAVAIVGTRHATHYGRTMAERIAHGLVQYGITVVSGLARGIDGVAHRAAIEAGGRTIAVLGSSVHDIYPPEHDSLAERIASYSVLLSETHPFAKPKAGVFPQRNRVISGMSLGVIVIEAADRSGSLITARHAGEQGRDVFALPGPVTSRMSRGSNRLIRDGAILIQDAEDVVEHLGPLFERVRIDEKTVIHHPAELQLNDMERTVLQSVEATPIDIDQLIAICQLPVPRVLSTLSVLEMRGLIKRPSGRTVIRT